MLTKRRTLQEIAAMAGVSITTASMVLNGKARQNHISPKTEERVLSLIQQEHFTPNVAAKAIVGGRTNLIGFVMRDEIDKSFWAEILAGTVEELEKVGMHLILSFTSLEMDRVFQSLEFLRSKRVDAYVLVPYYALVTSNEAMDKLREYGKECPLVMLTILSEEFDSIAVSEENGGKLAANHFLALGHRKLATIGNINIVNGRLQFFTDEARAKGATVEQFHDIQEFLPQARNFTGVFCFSDNIAVQLMNQCSALDIRVPDDLSVMGYDNQPIAEMTLPKLTTIHQPKRSFGKQIAQLLLQRLNSPESSERIRIALQPKLIVRDSTAKMAH